MSWTRRLLAVAAASALLLASPMAAAPGWTSHDAWYDPDNATQYVSSVSLTTNGASAVWNGRFELDRSDVNTAVGTGDINVYDGYYGDTGWAGQAECINVTVLADCDVFEVRFNQTYMDSYTAQQWMKVGCHEFGHTGGLDHRTTTTDSDLNSCMRQGTANLSLDFDQHDLDVINDDV